MIVMLKIYKSLIELAVEDYLTALPGIRLLLKNCSVIFDYPLPLSSMWKVFSMENSMRHCQS